jgi:hypothetical protein
MGLDEAHVRLEQRARVFDTGGGGGGVRGGRRTSWLRRELVSSGSADDIRAHRGAFLPEAQLNGGQDGATPPAG